MQGDAVYADALIAELAADIVVDATLEKDSLASTEAFGLAVS